jgi:PHP-associated
MNVDLHSHTYPASTCSHISHRDYVAWCVDHDIEGVALTNHGDVSDNRKLGPALAAEGVLLIHGVEISTPVGDYVVFSPDLDYLASFLDVQDAPRKGELPDHAALVWVHPVAGGGRSGSTYQRWLAQLVGGIVDAVEVYNGNWLGERYVAGAEDVAAQLAVARTAGSDAHQVQRLMCCYTELPDPVTSTVDVVTAIKSGVTIPHRPPAARHRRFGVF